MRILKKELMDKLGVGYELGAYDAYPLSYYDGDSGRTCNAEVRMDADGQELEAEIQMMYDTPPEGKASMVQCFWIKANAVGTAGEWELTDIKLQDEPEVKEIGRWQEKSCKFFGAVIQELQTDTIPDIEDLIDLHFHSRDRLGDQRQGGGGKSPKIKANQLLNMKKM